jgi:hypothetical protein
VCRRLCSWQATSQRHSRGTQAGKNHVKRVDARWSTRNLNFSLHPSLPGALVLRSFVTLTTQTASSFSSRIVGALSSPQIRLHMVSACLVALPALTHRINFHASSFAVGPRIDPWPPKLQGWRARVVVSIWCKAVRMPPTADDSLKIAQPRQKWALVLLL